MGKRTSHYLLTIDAQNLKGHLTVQDTDFHHQRTTILHKSIFLKVADSAAIVMLESTTTAAKGAHSIDMNDYNNKNCTGHHLSTAEINMSTEPTGTRRLLRNLQLIASWWNLFVFALHPLSTSVLFLCVCANLDGFGITRSLVWPLVILCFAYFAFMSILMANTRDEVQGRLRKAGYVQQVTPRRVFGLAFNFAVCVPLCYWVREQQERITSQFGFVAYALLVVCSLWGSCLLVLYGPTIRFTVKERPVTQE